MNVKSLNVLIFALVCLYGTPLFAMGKKPAAPFDGKAWEGTYLPVGTCPHASSVEVKFEPTTNDGPTLQFKIIPADGNPYMISYGTYAHLGGETYLAENSCFSDGLMVRAHMVATADEITEIDEKLLPGPICEPTPIVTQTWTTIIAQRDEDLLTTDECVFKRTGR